MTDPLREQLGILRNNREDITQLADLAMLIASNRLSGAAPPHDGLVGFTVATTDPEKETVLDRLIIENTTLSQKIDILHQALYQLCILRGKK
jgi:hypothetical protein